MNFDLKLGKAASVLFLALAMVGCGGGGTTMPEPEPPMPDPAIAERAAIATAIGMARTAVDAVDNDATDAMVTAADNAITAAKKAIADATNVPTEEKSANSGTVSAFETALTTAKARRTAAMNDAADKMKMEMAAAGKALKAALGSNPLGNLDRTTNPSGASLTTAGLVLDQTQGSLAADPAAVTLSAGDSAGSLGVWKGMHYAVTNPGTKVSDTAVVYGNQADPTVKAFAEGATFGADQAAFDAAYTASTRTLNLGADPASTSDIKGTATQGYDMFPTAGTTTYQNTQVDPVMVRGTYQGAPGKYTCSAATCTAAVGTSGAIDLGGQWYFVHDSGAMTSKADANYLYFGWWLNKDKDGEPTAASAFTGVAGTAPAAISGVNAIVGNATYTGKAAGKFALSNPLDGTGDAGHFTADATLNAKFSGTGAGISGTINNFMANDKAVSWSVALNNRTLAGDTVGAAPANNIGSDGAITSAPDYATATPNVDDSKTTVWSIDGNAAPASGTWSGQMYDEAQGTATDGSDVPTTVIGTFQSEFGSIGSMVGGFGATKE